MSSAPEDDRRRHKDGETDADEEPQDRPPGVQASGGGSTTKFGGVMTSGELQRVGGQSSGKYPIERRSVGSRAVEAETEEEEEEEITFDGPPSPPAGAPRDPTASPSTGPAPSGGARAKVLAPGETGLSSTGISGLDAQYGGGLPNGSLFLLTSEPTTATSIFAAQYAAAGLSAGETVYYFSLEQPPEAVRQALMPFVKDESELERLHIIDGYPAQFANVPEEAKRRIGIGKGQNALATLESLLVDTRLKAPIRIIIESLTELLTHNEEERVFRALRVMRAVVRSLPATAVVTMVTPLHDDKTVTLAKHVADGVVEFHVERKGFGIYPYISVTKMRGVTGSARLLLFKETETGLWLESTKRVF